METENKLLKEILYEVGMKVAGPEQQPVIAGGAVRDSLLGREPRDYDLFILDYGIGLGRTQTLLTRCLSLFEDAVPISSNTFYSTSILSLLIDIEYKGKNVQIIQPSSMYSSAESLISQFDWNICQFAYTKEGVIGNFENLPKTGESLILTNDSNARSSLRRAFDFSKRYGMKIRPADLLNLSLCCAVDNAYMINDFNIDLIKRRKLIEKIKVLELYT